jgi:hypothetical protein
VDLPFLLFCKKVDICIADWLLDCCGYVRIVNIFGIAFGYNAETDTYEDLMKAGIMDPTKVVRLSLQNAASVAS